MIRKIIEIDKDKCNGCGACANACHEGAIGMVDGKATLLRDDYCDGLGDCLPVCPADAIRFVEREADAYDEAAVMENMKVRNESHLSQWPVQIKLAPIQAPYYDNSHLLIAADCTAYAYGNFHKQFLQGKITLIGCPKLDAVDYSIKLEQIIRQNNFQTITVVRMIVPCCGGMEHAVKMAISRSGKSIPCQVVTIDMDGKILNK